MFPDTGAAGLLYNGDHVVGVYTPDKGINKEGIPKEDFQRGYAIHGKMLVLAEGVLGSVTEEVSSRYHLKSGGQRTYGLGIKEVWEVPGCEKIVGKVVHTIGYPLQRSFHDSLLILIYRLICRYGGGFLYIQAPSQVHIGYVWF